MKSCEFCSGGKIAASYKSDANGGCCDSACKDENYIRLDLDTRPVMKIDGHVGWDEDIVFPDSPVLWCDTSGGEYFELGFKVNYCPVCGRKLIKEDDNVICDEYVTLTKETERLKYLLEKHGYNFSVEKPSMVAQIRVSDEKAGGVWTAVQNPNVSRLLTVYGELPLKLGHDILLYSAKDIISQIDVVRMTEED